MYIYVYIICCLCVYPTCQWMSSSHWFVDNWGTKLRISGSWTHPHVGFCCCVQLGPLVAEDSRQLH